ncbi:MULTISPECIES: UTP--glucose-1-phosphate uridylyltransferase GalU [unclassified Leucobacter]|uniref:UTP--glucose-1-phosphate uridylyltransferase GalU n=1 Tax=unclassified Leucobacter TaxID=2621730 RepID=UPI00165D5FB3|nr:MULTISPECIES: UTP--glucose-1-phosphate uridylyltransferase GalU [unclassified Leucobacter]MBC9936694.1 UTP--glucose-1-phosphate uridylyltransferase GalU [Leucobacter sp. cx-87]
MANSVGTPEHTASRVTKAVIPAAGLGTRFLPATKAMPKEMLPIVDKPAIQYVVEEAAASGLRDVLVITGRNKENLNNHFDSVPELELTLRNKGDDDRLDRVSAASEIADVHFLRQGQPLGLGHAVGRARNHVGNESFAVLLGDDLIDERDPLLTHMIAEHDRRESTVIALMEVEPSQIHLYGCADVELTDDPDVVRIRGLVEKPAAAEAPSNLAIIGRYVLRPDIFDVLANQAPGRGGEIQLTDALNRLADGGNGNVYGVIFRGRRYDTGDRADWIKANVKLGVEHPEIGTELRDWIIGFAETLRPGSGTSTGR